MKDWVECESCGTEFRVVSDSDELLAYCPFCGADVENEVEEDDYEEDQDYDFDD